MCSLINVRSNYSLLYGGSRIEELIETARSMGYRRLALADRDGMYGAIPFYTAAQEAGLQPILGVELTCGRAAQRERLLVLARHLEGYRALCRLVSGRHLDPNFDLAEAAVAENGRGDSCYWISLTAELAARLEGRMTAGRFFVGIDFHGARSERLRQEGLARAASRLKIPVVAAPLVAFHRPDRYRLHRVLRAIDLGLIIDQVPQTELAPRGAYLRGWDSVAADYGEWPQALANARMIAEDCNLTLELGRPVFPSFPLPEGESAYSHLAKLAFDGLSRRHGRLRPEALHRLERELLIIERLGFSAYFLIVWEIAGYARSQNIPVVARGSAANSLVVYALGLSNVDPLAYDLYFERFLNLSRSDCPDIDLDICWRRRQQVIDYIYQRYGNGHVAMLSTHTTYQARSAFRDVARVAGYPIKEINRLSHMLPYYGAEHLREAIASFPESRSFPLDEPGMSEILAVSEALDGFPRHLSVHVGGVVIADRPLTDYAPVEPSTNGVIITQYDMGPVERLGLVKMDILAQRSLSIIEDTCRMIEQNHGLRIKVEEIPDGDPSAAATLREGRTIGCFQIESPGMRNLLKMMSANCRRDVIHALSLIRPGPSSSGMKERFIRRCQGEEPASFADRRLRDVLGETYGVMLYQEDVLRVAHVMAGFSLEKADALRKAMTKKRSSEQMQSLREDFLRGVLQRGGSRELADVLWDQIGSFAGYSYCKAHACTYGHISYQCVYLKSHWPAEYMAAVLANQAGYYEPREYLEEARRLGVEIRGADLNRSRIECEALREVRPTAAGGDDRKVVLRVGLRHVRNLTHVHLEALRAERERGGAYGHLLDLMSRVALSREEAENLILCGAMDCFGRSRPELLWQLDRLGAASRRARPKQSRQASSLFVDAGATEGPRAGGGGKAGAAESMRNCPQLPDYPPALRLHHEAHILGLTPMGHPLAVLGAELKLPPDRIGGDQLAEHVGRRVSIAGIVMAARRARTQSGEFMKFVSLEDEHGLVECVLFPDVYHRYGHLLIHRGPYVARGIVESQHGALTLTVERLWLAEELATGLAG